MTLDLAKIAAIRALKLRLSCDATCDKFGKRWRGLTIIHINDRKPITLTCTDNHVSYNMAMIDAYQLANETRDQIYSARQAV